MSAKWHRSRAWDDRFFPPWATPFKRLLRLFSGIPLAVVLLSLIIVYATLASVPIGLLARIPTWVTYGLTLVVCMALLGGLFALGGFMLGRRAGGPWLWASGAGLVGAVVAAAGWAAFIWPMLRYDWGTGAGLMFFPSFCDAYRSVTLRRLPAFEMTELEFYSWWPLRLLLILFVLNMVIATVRRIEFRPVNIGVLTVHTGIVVLAVGSIYYGSVKQEGDILLIAGSPTARGHMTPGPAEDVFYDGQRVALHVRAVGESWAQLPLRGVPRYNHSNLMVSPGETLFGPSPRVIDARQGEPLSVEAPPPPTGSFISDLRFRIVGYAAYGDQSMETDWVRADIHRLSPAMAAGLNPMREVTLRLPIEEDGVVVFRETSVALLPRMPASRVEDMGAVAIEYTMGRAASRTADLLEATPFGATQALVVEVRRPGGDPFREVYPLSPGFGDRQPPERIEVGDTGFVLEVLRLEERPSLPIVTPGYEGAQSSLAVVRIHTPDELGTPGESFDRWIYHRFPELAQDLLDETTDDGRQARRAADPRIHVGYLDLSRIQFYLDESSSGEVEMIIRAPDGEVTVIHDLGAHEGHAEVVRLGRRWDHAERFERPLPVPRHLQEEDQIGTHDKAAIAVEVTSTRIEGWSALVWVPFTRYLDRRPHEPFRRQGTERWVLTPDGRPVQLAFGRLWRRLPGFELQLLGFEMIEYEHRGAPRDYQSTVRVRSTPTPVERFQLLPEPLRGLLPESVRRGRTAFESFEHTARLNAPLRAPFNVYDTSSSLPIRFMGRLASGLDANQFKFAQAGWDPQTWERTRDMVDRGELDRPYVSHTILHVGNNPGIHVIALGGILMGLGTPWAFYVKPWILRRQRERLRRGQSDVRTTAPAPDDAPGEQARHETPVGARA